jgi:sugar-specific transcriptional regulator TrmB
MENLDINFNLHTQSEEKNMRPPVSNGRLEEARFWTRILKEHALFIQLGLPCDETELINEAQMFFERFQNLEDRLMNTTTIDPQLLQSLIKTVEEIIQFKDNIMRMILQCELRSSLIPLLIAHIRREAQRFLELLKTPKPVNLLEDLVDLEVFWLRIMKEHIEFIIRLLDPSERELLEESQQMKEIFSRLLETARDLQSMALSNPTSFDRVIRFTDEVVEKTLQLRNFKAAAKELVALCKVLSTVPDPLLLDHVRREADKFLQDIEELRALLSE